MMTSTPTPRGLGISADLDAGLARELAARCEQLGYHSMWSNDEPAAPVWRHSCISPRRPHRSSPAVPPRWRVADGVLLNWMLPGHVAEARRRLQEGADKAGRAAPILASYVRVAVGSGSLQRLRDEERNYRSIDERHRRHFAAMDVPLGSVGVAASTRPEVDEKLAPYQSALDLPIVRVLANADATSLTAVADAAAP
jgi:alkanesulfonate monooxygenase SsuD/methylene tetrahydromethanopterin reductase-like flavin-dependent oxidoreductase (luciferase family)